MELILIIMNDGVVSCCDGNFNEKYNELYSLLKYYNITF